MSDSLLRLLLDNRQAKKQGGAAIEQRQRTRLVDLVTFARTNSPYYHELYRDLPEQIDEAAVLPVTNKKELMARFDDWVTDREVTFDKVRSFVENPGLIGDYFLSKYTALTTSGTTGARGIFLLDNHTMAVTNSLALRMLGSWLETWDIFQILVGRGRMAIIMAAGSHFASAVAAARLRKRLGRRIAILPVDMPLAEMVERLNRFQPALMAPYASMAAILASEQDAGRLRIQPVLLVLSAEGLTLNEYERVARSFNAKVRHSYAATECPFLSYSCAQNWLHVNADWVVFEPVDANYKPIPTGQQSHTVLISNLANRVQPILRYDLGDSIMQRSDPCPCGNPLPAIRVQGRAADVLTFYLDGEQVRIPPLVFVTLVERIPAIDQIQIVQTTPTSLRVRLRTAADAEPDHVWKEVNAGITRVLTEHKLAGVGVERAEEPPQQSSGGKYREIVPMNSG